MEREIATLREQIEDLKSTIANKNQQHEMNERAWQVHRDFIENRYAAMEKTVKETQEQEVVVSDKAASLETIRAMYETNRYEEQRKMAEDMQ